MDESTRVIIILVLALLLLMLLAFMGSRFLFNRAVKQVINAFRDASALSPSKAMTLEDLGLVKRRLFQFGALRDYRPMALQILVRGNIIQQTEDGRFFLSEEALGRANTRQENR